MEAHERKTFLEAVFTTKGDGSPMAARSMKGILSVDAELLHFILVGHLHVESMLDDLIKCWMVTPSLFGDARLSFMQKLHLARSFNLTHPNEPIWAAVTKLNQLRNELAHNLATDDKEKKIHAFIKATDADLPVENRFKPDDLHDIGIILLGCLSYILVCLEQMIYTYRRRADILQSFNDHLLKKHNEINL